jgi:hypothetical protein
MCGDGQQTGQQIAFCLVLEAHSTLRGGGEQKQKQKKVETSALSHILKRLNSGQQDKLCAQRWKAENKGN